MSAVLEKIAPVTLADMKARLGFVPDERIRCSPPPGSATEQDVIAIMIERNGCSSWLTECWWRRRWDIWNR